MLLFLDIYGFDGIPSFPPEIATFINGTLTIFPKLLRKVPNYHVNSCSSRKVAIYIAGYIAEILTCE